MKKNNQELDFQNLANAWSKVQFIRLKKHLSIARMKGHKLTKKFMEHDWKSDAKNVEDVFYVNKAIFNGASKNLPFKTLYLLGHLLTEKPVHDEVLAIIKNNVIKHKGIFYKLDDLDKQAQIRKILRTYQFEKMDQLKAA